ncbi:TniB family NTP-binding protein [Leptolyngbya sp. NIES-2104]|uniref:TniB family NTP-binding protein n=1 Tax=Leptolyngbya sp. NIES-2104 TaxID=1552121 RepID=UPI0006EC5AFA|nr:TniB family NTP-binding protein [Leptolyngbya sp. NIES-2104]GAQ00064.1 hypothetical protein NIES2104_66290 [Leptolyngbya sp. NIES-2104]
MVNPDEMNEQSVPNDQTETAPQLNPDIARLQRRWIVELEQMRRFHQWLDEKRTARQPCRVVGDSRTGKTRSEADPYGRACDTYRLKHPPTLITGQPPHIPVVSWQSPPDSGNRDLFEGILQALRYQLNRGTLSEMRSRVYRTLKACQVEMLIVDEAHRLRRN